MNYSIYTVYTRIVLHKANSPLVTCYHLKFHESIDVNTILTHQSHLLSTFFTTVYSYVGFCH